MPKTEPLGDELLRNKATKREKNAEPWNSDQESRNQDHAADKIILNNRDGPSRGQEIASDPPKDESEARSTEQNEHPS